MFKTRETFAKGQFCNTIFRSQIIQAQLQHSAIIIYD